MRFLTGVPLAQQPGHSGYWLDTVRIEAEVLSPALYFALYQPLGNHFDRLWSAVNPVVTPIQKALVQISLGRFSHPHLQ